MKHLVVPLEGVVFEERARLEGSVAAAAAYLDRFCLLGGGGSALVRPPLAIALADTGGFEDMVDLSWGLVFYFLTSLAPPLRPPLRVVEDEDDVKEVFATVGLRMGELIGRAEYDPSGLLDEVARRGGGRDGLRAAVGGDTIENYILDDALRQLVHSAYVGEGRFLDDEVRVAPTDLRELREHAKLTLVTTRDEQIAQGLLMRHGLLGAYDQLLANDGREGPLLPSLLAAAVGDGPAFVLCPNGHWVRAAAQAGAVAVGFATSPAQRRPLAEAGATAVVSRLSRLSRVLARSPR